VAAYSERSVKAPGPSSRRRLESNLCFETWPAACDQVIAWIRKARVAPLGVRPVCAPCRRNGRLRHLQLGEAGAAGKLFDRGAVKIARREIHLGKSVSSLEHIVDQADPFEQLGPIDV